MSVENIICEANELKKEGKLDEAEKLLNDLIDENENKNNYKAYYLLAGINRERGKYSVCKKFYEKALEINPEYTPGLNDYAGLLNRIGRPDEGMKLFTKALDIETNLNFLSNVLLALNYSNLYNAAAKFECTLLYESFLKKLKDLKSNYDYNNVLKNKDKIKVGYVSTDFKRHSVAYFISSILENYNKSIFEVYCYSDVSDPDKTTEYFKDLVDHFVDIHNKTDDEVESIILKDEIDILIDLTGHTAGGKRLPIFAKRGAAIQITYLGYPNTTGLTNMDYRITDLYADNEESQKYYTEKLIKMDKSFLCFNYPKNLPDIKLKGLGENGEEISFVNFNNYTKFTDQMIRLWGRILKAVPNSKLVLKNEIFGDMELCEAFKERFENLGVDKKRVVFLSHMYETVRHLDKYNEMDIALDTYPYNGTTTTVEAMIMGVPVITLAGDEHLSRVGKSILSNVGLEELIAYNEEDYVNKVISLALDKKKLYEIKCNLRQKMIESMLIQRKIFTSDYEKVLKGLWSICSYKQAHNKNKEDDEIIISSILEGINRNDEICDTIIEALQYLYNLSDQSRHRDNINVVLNNLKEAIYSIETSLKFLSYKNKELREIFLKIQKGIKIVIELYKINNYEKLNEVLEEVIYKGICIIKDIIKYEEECLKYVKEAL